MNISVFIAHEFQNTESESGRFVLNASLDELDVAERLCVESIVIRVRYHSRQVSSDAFVDGETEISVSICVNHRIAVCAAQR